MGNEICFVSEPLDGVCISLDCAQAEFLTPDRAVISLKGGELYILSLLVSITSISLGFRDPEH